MIAYEYPLQCPAARCLSEEQAVLVELPPAVVSFVRLDTERGVEARVAWPTARVLSRTGGAVMAVPAEASFGELPCAELPHRSRDAALAGDQRCCGGRARARRLDRVAGEAWPA